MLLDLGIIRGVDQKIDNQIIFININGLRISIFMLIKSICSITNYSKTPIKNSNDYYSVFFILTEFSCTSKSLSFLTVCLFGFQNTETVIAEKRFCEI